MQKNCFGVAVLLHNLAPFFLMHSTFFAMNHSNIFDSTNKNVSIFVWEGDARIDISEGDIIIYNITFSHPLPWQN